MNKKIFIFIFLLVLVVALVGCAKEKAAPSEVKTGLEEDINNLNETDTDFSELNELDSEINEIEDLDI